MSLKYGRRADVSTLSIAFYYPHKTLGYMACMSVHVFTQEPVIADRYHKL
jgi:hypothetical protein